MNDNVVNAVIGYCLLGRRSVCRGVLWYGQSCAKSFRICRRRCKTWQESKIYILQPFEKRGEMDQGIVLLAFYSLMRVAKGFCSASLMATPLGFMLGLSKTFIECSIPSSRCCGRFRPWPGCRSDLIVFQKSEPAALFTIALCSMWPTVINTMSGVQAIPQEYWNVAKVLRLSQFKTFTKVLVPATLPHMFTGYRLSLGIAWLVIVASEMLTGTPGIGGFLWQEYNSLIYAHILLCILTIGSSALPSIA